jgi:creatinine amidohydrolase
MLYTDLTYKNIALATDKIILLPLGATEQHGPHLAVSTDTDIVSKLASAAEQSLTGSLLLCPTLFVGSSDHHLSFGGTLSVPPYFYTELIVHIVSSMLGNGFRKIVLLNGHGGNITPVKQALTILGNQFDESLQPNIALATYWQLAGKAFAGEPPMESLALSHACEYETSLMLHLFPEKVWMEKAQRAARPASNGYIAFEDDEPYKGVTLFKSTAFISGNGSSGEPGLATEAKGKFLFNTAHSALVEFLLAFNNWPFLPNLTTTTNG